MGINHPSLVARTEQELPVSCDKTHSSSLLQGKHWRPNPSILWSTGVFLPCVSCQRPVLGKFLLSPSGCPPSLLRDTWAFLLGWNLPYVDLSLHYVAQHIHLVICIPEYLVLRKKKKVEPAEVLATSMCKVFLKEAVLWRKSHNTVPPWTYMYSEAV